MYKFLPSLEPFDPQDTLIVNSYIFHQSSIQENREHLNLLNTNPNSFETDKITSQKRLETDKRFLSFFLDEHPDKLDLFEKIESAFMQKYLSKEGNWGHNLY